MDDKGIVQHIPDGEIAWHSGTTRGNEISIGVEICVHSDGDFEASVRNAAVLVRELLKAHNLTLDKVVQHNHWNGKNCPRTLRESGRWEEFINMIEPSKEKKYLAMSIKTESTLSTYPLKDLRFFYGISTKRQLLKIILIWVFSAGIQTGHPSRQCCH